MSELQIVLLAIGLIVIAAVYFFGWWQQRRYRIKFAASFKANRADALYSERNIGSAGRQSPRQSTQQLETASEAGKVTGVPYAPALVASQPTIGLPAINLPDEPCLLLDIRTDFIIELSPDEPSPAAALDGLWQRKFDFRKPVQVCGLTLAQGGWERVIAESQVLYGRFRVALQLVDRSGAISEAKLADFQDLVLSVAKQCKAATAVPDIHETYLHAVDLDAFCAAVDRMIGVNLVPQGGRLLIGKNIALAADLQGMTLESDGAFHLLDAQGRSLFSLINQDAQPFQHHTLETFSTPGVTLLLDVPRVENPALHFDQMIRVAHELARELQVNVEDDLGVALSDISLAGIREQITGVESKMCDYRILPGSGQARRLFS